MTNNELRKRYTKLSNMYETDGHNYDAKADECHKLKEYENELYYRKLATKAYRYARITLEVCDYLLMEMVRA